ncbi:MAG: hypothetical protein JW827_01790, partial [Spirochaetes bacterium]|nr:hypothetical protein [Spirochaetota bacterium]
KKIKLKTIPDKGESIWVGYRDTRYPKQVYSLKMGLNRTRKDLSKVTAPILLMHSRGDRSVPFENMDYIAKHVSSKIVRIKEFDLRERSHNRHLLSLYPESRYKVIREIEQFLKKIK